MRLEALFALLHPAGNPDGVDLYGEAEPYVPEREALSQDRIAVVRGGLLRRRRIARRARGRGLRVEEILLRGRPETREILSLHEAAISTSFQDDAPTRGGVSVLRRMPPRVLRTIASCTSRVALVVHVPDAPPARWLSALEPAEPSGRHPFVLSIARDAARVHACRFDAHGPQALAKVAFDEHSGERLRREAVGLRHVAAGADVGGVAAPVLLDTGTLHGNPVLLESFVAGGAVAPLLASHPELLEETCRRLADWLGQWAVSTSASTSGVPSSLEASLVGSIESLAGVIETSQLEWLAAQTNELLSRPVTIVAAHNDLTMWNVLRREDGALSVVDWEAASPEGLPLTDLFYVLADGVAATREYVDRTRAFQECFRSSGARAGWARSLVLEQARALRLEGRAIAMSFTACWLQHAADDARRGAGEGFVELLRDLTDAPEMFWPLDGSP